MCGKNKVADQLCSYCTADLRLCFHICRLFVFLCGGSYVYNQMKIITKICLCNKQIFLTVKLKKKTKSGESF